MTFFVVPVLVVRGVGPVEAIKQSSSLRAKSGRAGDGELRFRDLLPAGGGRSCAPSRTALWDTPDRRPNRGCAAGRTGDGSGAGDGGDLKAALYEYAAEGVVPQGFEGAPGFELRASLRRPGAEAPADLERTFTVCCAL